VVLAAGEGARAWPYCGVRQKVTVPILNVPMVRRLVLDLSAAGIRDIVVVVGHRSESVRHCLGDIADVRFVMQQPLNGPVDAALRGLAEIAGDTALVCCADIVTSQANIRKMANAAAKGDTVVMTAPCPPGLTASYTCIDADATGLVREILGRGELTDPRFAGVLGGKTDLLKHYYARDPGIMLGTWVGTMPPPESNLAFALDMIRKDGHDVRAVAADDFFVDVDKPWHIIEANYKAGKHFFDSLESSVIGEGARIEDGADIANGAKLLLGPGALIGKGCRIGGSIALGAGSKITSGAITEPGVVIGGDARCEEYAKVGSGSVIGDGGVLSHCAEFDGVTFERVFLYHYCCVTALIGRNVDVGAATVCGTWRFDDGVRVQNVQGRKETPECYGSHTYIGDYCRTGVNVIFMPGVKIGSYSCIGGGAILYDDVPDRTLLLPKQEHVLKPWGPEKYGW
jgi:bifunctional UDP-N-acetylglucosamine pyrophosphorylase/glucosamine-1-phosphate N-acetyltransferase